MEYLKFEDVKEGDTVIIDEGFNCMKAGKKRVYADEEEDLYIECDYGNHYLVGQEDEKGFLIGITK